MTMRPLMKNWTEAAAIRRDAEDYKKGRGKGLIDDDITAKHREELIRTPDNVAGNKRKSCKKAKAESSSKTMLNSVEAAGIEDMMGRMMTQMTDHINNTIRKEMDSMPDKCAKKVLKMLNTTGAMYKPSTDNMSNNNDQKEKHKKEGMASTRNHGLKPKDFMDTDDLISSREASRSGEDKGLDHDSSSEEASLPGTARVDSFVGLVKKEPVDDTNFVTPTEKKAMDGTDADYTTPVNLGASAEVPIQIDENGSTPQSSSSISIHDLTISWEKVISLNASDDASDECDSVDSVGTIFRKVINSGKKEDIGSAALFRTENGMEGLFQLTPELIDAAVQFLQTACRTKKNRGKSVYQNALRARLSAESLNAVLDSNWLCGGVIEAYLGDLRIKVGDDRTLCPAWRANSIVEKPPVRGRRKKQTAEKMSIHEKSACYGRCVDGYFATNKAFFAVNINKCHWITVLMHRDKMEFQVLDSLFDLRHSKKFVEKLRAEIAKDVAHANKDISDFKFPDVSKWPIKSYDIPKQKDGNSCGLFMLQCMEHWDGDEMKSELSQEIVDNSRGRIVAEVVMASTNLNAKVKNTVLDIAAMAQA
ncbi:hypothetical protein ACQ4PT_034113 [Festuca glaucescens]